MWSAAHKLITVHPILKVHRVIHFLRPPPSSLSRVSVQSNHLGAKDFLSLSMQQL